MRDATTDDPLLKLFRRGGHAAVALAELHHVETVAAELRDDLRCVPPVKGDLADVVEFAEVLDFGADEVVVDQVAGGLDEEALAAQRS